MNHSENSGTETVHAKDIVLRSFSGDIQIQTLAPKGVTAIDSDVINLSADRAFLDLRGTTDKCGGISLMTQGDKGCIQLNTPGSETGTLLTLTPQGFVLAYGSPGGRGIVEVQKGQMILSMIQDSGAVITTNSILALKPESISLKVGGAILTLTAEGLFTTVGNTDVKVTSNGISESLGSTTRELSSEGHSQKVGEVAVDLGYEGISEKTVNYEVVADYSFQQDTVSFKSTSTFIANKSDFNQFFS